MRYIVAIAIAVLLALGVGCSQEKTASDETVVLGKVPVHTTRSDDAGVPDTCYCNAETNGLISASFTTTSCAEPAGCEISTNGFEINASFVSGQTTLTVDSIFSPIEVSEIYWLNATPARTHAPFDVVLIDNATGVVCMNWTDWCSACTTPPPIEGAIVLSYPNDSVGSIATLQILGVLFCSPGDEWMTFNADIRTAFVH